MTSWLKMLTSLPKLWLICDLRPITLSYWSSDAIRKKENDFISLFSVIVSPGLDVGLSPQCSRIVWCHRQCGP